jgi:ribosomal protein S18 acetylase RimI-like enzyme
MRNFNRDEYCQRLQFAAMPLPILHVSNRATPESLVRYFYQTERHWTQHIGEEAQLDVGTAFTNPQLPLVHDANRVFDVALPEGTTAAEAVELVRQHFAERGTQCHQWLLNASARPSQVEPVIEQLQSAGCIKKSQDVLHLHQSPSLATTETLANLKIIPARASFRHVRELFDVWSNEKYSGEEARQLTDGGLMHLDDPHYDSLLAIENGTAVAHVGVLAVGETGRIEDVYVAPTHRRRGIGRIMLLRALEICARSLFKHVMLSCEPQNEPAQSLYRSLGFDKIGEIAWYAAPAQTRP